MQQAPERITSARPIKKRPERRLPFPLDLYQSAVGKKWVMAITGIILLGYVLVHMIGNLKLYYGPESMNSYAQWLRELLYPLLQPEQALWIMRLVLLAAFLIHLHAAYSLTVLNRRARPVGYQSQRDYIAASFASRTMRWTGIIVLLFLLFHLADLTGGRANPDFIEHDPYNNVVVSFERLPVAAFYVLANLALGVHIFHGAWSLFQSLGANNPRLNPLRRPIAAVLTGVIVLGNISFPIAVQAGLISQENRTTPYANELHEAGEHSLGSPVHVTAEAAR